LLSAPTTVAVSVLGTYSEAHLQDRLASNGDALPLSTPLQGHTCARRNEARLRST